MGSASLPGRQSEPARETLPRRPGKRSSRHPDSPAARSPGGRRYTASSSGHPRPGAQSSTHWVGVCASQAWPRLQTGSGSCLPAGRTGAPQGSSALEPSDSEIVEAVLAGDRDLYGLLFARYRPVLIAFALARVGSRVDAEGIAQDAFVRAYRSLDRLTDPDRFSSWLLRITSNLCMDWLKSAARSPRSLDASVDGGLEPSDESAGLSSDPAEIAQRREMGARIGAAIADLSEPYRTTASLRFLGGFSCAEIAAQLDQEIGTITMRLSRACKRLRDTLHDDAPDRRQDATAHEGVPDGRGVDPEHDGKEEGTRIKGRPRTGEAPESAKRRRGRRET